MALIISENTKNGTFSKKRMLSTEEVNKSYENSVKFINVCFESLFDYIPQTNKPKEITSDITDEEIQNIFTYALYGITRKYEKYTNNINNGVCLSDFNYETSSSNHVIPVINVTKNLNIHANKSANIKLEDDNLYFNTDSLEFREYKDNTFESTLLGKFYKNDNGSYCLFNNIFLSSLNAITDGVNLYTYLENSIDRLKEDSSYKSEISHDDYGLTHIYSLNKTSNDSCELKLNEQRIDIIKKKNNSIVSDYTLWDGLNSIPTSYVSSITMPNRTLTFNIKKENNSDEIISGDLDFFNGIYSYKGYSNGSSTVYNYAKNTGRYIEFTVDDGNSTGYKEDKGILTLQQKSLNFRRYRINSFNTVLIDQTYELLKIPTCFRFYDKDTDPNIEIMINGIISPNFMEYGSSYVFKQSIPQDVEISANGHYYTFGYVISIKWYNSSGIDYLQIKYLNGAPESSSPEIRNNNYYYYASISTVNVSFSNIYIAYDCFNDYNS